MLKFEPRGPVYEEAGTTIEFKRISAVELNSFNVEYNPFKDRSAEEYAELIKMVQNDESHLINYTAEEISRSMAAAPDFCLRFYKSIKNLQDSDGNEIDFEQFDDETKKLFFEDLFEESDDFKDFYKALKAGAKKKFTEVDGNK